MTSELANQRCAPCHGGTPPVAPAEAEQLLTQLAGWQIADGKKLVKTYRFADFVAAVNFVNVVTPVIEQEGHHPVLTVRWGRVRVAFWTHAIDALSENDFVMAAKFDRLYEGTSQ